MKKRFFSLLIAVILVLTVVTVPTTSISYGTNNDDNAAAIDDVIDISNAVITIDKLNSPYTGQEIMPQVSVEHNGVVLNAETDYTVEYFNNVKSGTANVKIKGVNNYTGTKTVDFVISPANISDAVIKLNKSQFDYAETAITPDMEVTYNGIVLSKGVDYDVTYSNNTYPGTASVTITGIGNFTASKTASFNIGEVNGFKTKSIGPSSMTLEWEKCPNVTGYKIYRYNSAKKAWYVAKTVKSNSINTAQIKKLTAGYGYDFKMRSYVTKGGKLYYGPFTSVLSVPTRPSKAKLKSLTTSIKLTMTAKWYKRSCTGYQVKIARNSKFKDAKTFKVDSSKTLSKKITGLRDGSKYYVKVRAYKTYGGKTVYGSWSPYKTIKADGTGWATLSGKKYYYKNGKPLKGNYKISGSKYYFDKSSGVLRGASTTMWNKVKNKTSKTKYLVAVSRELNRVCVYKKSNGSWVVYKYMKCTTGAKSTPSPRGSFTVPKKKTYLGFFGLGRDYYCWYATRIVGGVYFHSVLYQPASKTALYDGRLGQNLSHGCIRLELKNAKWMYDNIKPGTKVVIY